MRSHSSTFGCQLEKHLESTKREIALVIEECVRYLFQYGMNTEVMLNSLFSTVNQFSSSFDQDIWELRKLSNSLLINFHPRVRPSLKTFIYMYQGLFRIAGQATKVRKLKVSDPNINVLKQYNHDYRRRFLHLQFSPSEGCERVD